MSKTSDTRSLTQEAAPHILREGRNPSVAEIKDWVRLHKGLPDWNPSTTTVQDELNSFRKHLGKALLKEVAFPGIDEELAGVTGEYFRQIHEILRQAAWSSLQQDRAQLELTLMQSKDDVAKAQERAQEAADRLEEQTVSFEIKQQRMLSDKEHQDETIRELRSTIDELRIEVASLGAGKQELETQVVRITAERASDVERFDAQLRLANDRFRDLERAKLQELDNARTQRDKAESEVASLKKELTEARIAVGSASIQAGEARGEAKALRQQIGDLNVQTGQLNHSIEERVLENERLMVENQRLRSLLEAMETQLAEHRLEQVSEIPSTLVVEEDGKVHPLHGDEP